jgi:hypothetical protein
MGLNFAVLSLLILNIESVLDLYLPVNWIIMALVLLGNVPMGNTGRYSNFVFVQKIIREKVGNGSHE